MRPGQRRTIVLAVLLIAALIVSMTINVLSEVSPTPYWINFWGQNTLVNGEPIAVGTVIDAYDPQGAHCGTFTVHTEGSWGYMPVYGDDGLSAEDEGATSGDIITFRIGAVIGGTAVWPGTPSLPIEIDLEFVSVPLTEYKGKVLEHGLWYAPYGADVSYIRIYTIGGPYRIAVISNYPRAYRDTEEHIDKDDNPLPGAFPRWIEYNTLQLVTDTTATKFTLNAVPGSIELLDISLLKDGEVTNLDYRKFWLMISKQPDTITITTDDISATDRQILYFRYKREL